MTYIDAQAIRPESALALSPNVERDGHACSERANPETVLTPLWVVFGLAMGPVAGVGLSRFAYAL